MIGEPFINVDWLQFYCDMSEFQAVSPLRYERNTNAKGKTFGEIGTVYYQSQPVLEVSMKPYSTVISPTSGLVKIENSLLYHSQAVKVIDWLLSSCRIRVLSVTRVDVCGDFERIAGKTPSGHIYDILTGDVLKVGKSRMFVRGEDLWRLDGVRQVSKKTWVAFNSFDTVGDCAGRFVYMRYGSPTSNVLTYLYNKTRELREVKDKPYIRQRWVGAVNDVWRLEFSIKGRRFDYIYNETGEVMPRDWRLYFSTKVVDIYAMLCRHYWDVRQATGQTRKDREPKIVLWDGYHGDVITIADLTNHRPSNVRERRLIKQLHEEMIIARQDGNSELFSNVRSVGSTLLTRYNLMDWATRKGISFDEEMTGQLSNLPTL